MMDASKLWPTVTTSTGGPDPIRRDNGRSQSDLRTTAASWPARDGSQDRAFPPGEQWPTPAVMDATRSGDHLRQMTLDAGARGFRKGISLSHEASNWPTPTSLSFATSHQPGNSHSYNATMDLARSLEATMARWVTPSVAVSDGGQTSRSGDRKDELLLTGQAQELASFLLDRGIFQAGLQLSQSDPTWPPSSDETGMWPTPAASVVDIDTMERNTSAGYVRQAQKEAGSPYLARVSGVLNPAFVEWLMGWPTGWTAFACSETELSRFKLRMRFALSQLTSHAAPPAQLSLFG